MMVVDKNVPPVENHARGYFIPYRDGETNHCPGCGRTHWYIGRVTAECAFCMTALPLVDTLTGSASIVRRREVRLFDV